MKINHYTSSLFKTVASALVVIGSISSSQAVNVLVSGTSAAGDQQIIDFLNNNFVGVTVTYGDYSDTANVSVQNAINAADVFIIGRNLSSGAYTSADNSFYDSLSIPMVVMTGYVSRGGNLGWESGGAGSFFTTGDGTTVTAAGAAVFGAAGLFDWWSGGYTSWAAASGTVGSGQILATSNGRNLVVGWNAGDTDYLGNTFSGSRLVFNVPTEDAGPTGSIVPDTAAGQQALIDALATYTTLQVAPVPEPSTLALAGLSGMVSLLAVRRKKK